MFEIRNTRKSLIVINKTIALVRITRFKDMPRLLELSLIGSRGIRRVSVE